MNISPVLNWQTVAGGTNSNQATISAGNSWLSVSDAWRGRVFILRGRAAMKRFAASMAARGEVEGFSAQRQPSGHLLTISGRGYRLPSTSWHDLLAWCGYDDELCDGAGQGDFYARRHNGRIELAILQRESSAAGRSRWDTVTITKEEARSLTAPLLSLLEGELTTFEQELSCWVTIGLRRGDDGHFDQLLLDGRSVGLGKTSLAALLAELAGAGGA